MEVNAVLTQELQRQQEPIIQFIESMITLLKYQKAYIDKTTYPKFIENIQKYIIVRLNEIKDN